MENVNIVYFFQHATTPWLRCHTVVESKQSRNQVLGKPKNSNPSKLVNFWGKILGQRIFGNHELGNPFY